MQLESAIPDNTASCRHTLARVADRIGATASFLCAIHCAALPFVLTLLPILGLGFLASHTFEQIFIVCASLLATTTLAHGFRHHRVRGPLLLLFPGLTLLWTGGFLFHVHAGLNIHAVLVATGGSCVALAHLLNMRMVRGHAHNHGRVVAQESAIV
ncbi:MAG: MerC domain-containing protein [Rudaea sp.]